MQFAKGCARLRRIGRAEVGLSVRRWRPCTVAIGRPQVLDGMQLCLTRLAFAKVCSLATIGATAVNRAMVCPTYCVAGVQGRLELHAKRSPYALLPSDHCNLCHSAVLFV